MTAVSEVATVLEKDLPELHPLTIWFRVQSTMRLISTMCSTEAYTTKHYFNFGEHSIEEACRDVVRIAKREGEELRELRNSHRECDLDEALFLHSDIIALTDTLQIIATYCSDAPEFQDTLTQAESLDAMDVLAAQAYKRVSGPPPAAYDPPGGTSRGEEVIQ